MKKYFKYAIFQNQFHGGHFIAYATSLESAIRRMRKESCRPEICCCGGADIRRADGSPLSESEDEKIHKIIYGSDGRN